MMDIVTMFVFLALVSAFVIRAWKARGKLSARDRWALITGFVMAVTGFAIATLLINWVVVPTALWLVAVGLLAGGVVGAVLRWPELSWYEGTKPIWRTIRIIVILFICAPIIGLAFI